MKFMCVGAVVVVAGFSSVPPASATLQRPDTLIFGGRKYYTLQIPMLGLWDYSGGKLPPGKEKPPHFDFQSSANNSGYQATWEIRDSQLFLKRITGRIGGKHVKNEDILQGREFPAVATWFTGNIHLAVGGHDDETRKDVAVIVFHIQGGHVTKMTFLESSKPVHSWNGLE